MDQLVWCIIFELVVSVVTRWCALMNCGQSIIKFKKFRYLMLFNYINFSIFDCFLTYSLISVLKDRVCMLGVAVKQNLTNA